MSQPFSVLMSVYLSEKEANLKQSLDSILQQRLKPDEIIIVKDGPLSKSLNELLSDYEKRYPMIKLIELTENVGLGKALGIGVQNCKYELIARMDSDDVAVKSRFEIQMNYLKEHPEVSVIGSNITEFINDVNSKVGVRNVPEFSNVINEFSKGRNPANHMTVIFKKSDVLAVGNYKTMFGFEDYYLWLRMLHEGYKFHNIQENLVYARTDDNFFARRTGLQYLKKEIKFQLVASKEFLIPKKNIVKNIITRGTSRILPPVIMKKVYKNKVHKSN